MTHLGQTATRRPPVSSAGGPSPASANGVDPAVRSMRVAVFTDHIFWRDGDALYSDRVFPLFVARL